MALQTIEGTIDGAFWYHYDVPGDVLYLRLVSKLQTETYAEETPQGLLLLRTTDTEEVAGLTVVSWWKRFGAGEVPDSLVALQEKTEPWAHKVAA